MRAQIKAVVVEISSPQKLKTELSYDPAIPYLGMYPENSIFYHREICTSMFIAVLFTIARKLSQLRCQSTNEWIITMSYINKLEMLFTCKEH